MKDRVEILVRLGMSEEDSIGFIRNIADEAYGEGYLEGMVDEPAIVGVSLGVTGMDFHEWWGIQMNSNK